MAKPIITQGPQGVGGLTDGNKMEGVVLDGHGSGPGTKLVKVWLEGLFKALTSIRGPLTAL